MKKVEKYKSSIVSFIVLMLIAPYASADMGWLNTLTSNAKTVQIGMYALSAVIVLICVIISGAKLAYSRMTGSHDKSFWDYISDLSTVVMIGFGPAIAAGLWQLGSSAM